jgi:hypothetical protein
VFLVFSFMSCMHNVVIVSGFPPLPHHSLRHYSINIFESVYKQTSHLFTQLSLFSNRAVKN